VEGDVVPGGAAGVPKGLDAPPVPPVDGVPNEELAPPAPVVPPPVPPEDDPPEDDDPVPVVSWASAACSKITQATRGRSLCRGNFMRDRRARGISETGRERLQTFSGRFDGGWL